MARADQPTPQQIQLTPDQFLMRTRPKTIALGSSAYTNGGRTRFELPQVGLLNMLYLILQVQVVITPGSSGNITAGSFNNFTKTGTPPPWNLIKRLRFGTNNGTNMVDLSGWGLYMHLRDRLGIDPMNMPTVQNSSDMNTYLGGVTGSDRIGYGATIATGAGVKTFNFNIAVPIPIAYNQRGEYGLLVLQVNALKYALEIDWADWNATTTGTVAVSNDLVSGLTFSAGGTVATTCNATLGMHWFEPLEPSLMGNLMSRFKSLSEMNQALVSGENTIKLPSNDYYTLVTCQLINAGIPLSIAPGGTGIAGGRVQWSHSGNQVDVSDDPIVRAAHNMWLHGLTPIDGSVTFDWGMRNGNEKWRDVLDAFNDTQVTELAIKIPSGVAASGFNTIITVHESLKPIRQGI